LTLWIMAFIGGLLGSVLMDITENYMEKFDINSGVNGSYIGRWVHGLFRGKIFIPDIEAATPVHNELRIASIFHYLVGGGVVALAYPAILSFFNSVYFVWHIPLSIIFGLLTCVLPWFILMPSIGKGIFGRKMPMDKSPVTAPILSHLAYGLGIGTTLFFYDWLTI